MDIDNFKDYNDTYGHQAGDKVLAKLGEVILDAIRRTDTAFRYGGEEFTVILPETNGEGAVIVAERIRERFEAEAFSPKPDVDAHNTVSIGVTEHNDAEEMESLIKRADMAMYDGKENGKNQVIFSPKEKEEESPL